MVIYRAVKAGGTGDDRGWGIAVDSNDNSYITGYFDGTAEFGSTTLTSSGGYDVFIAKVDSSGNYLWTVKAGGTGFYDRGNGIAVDSNGNSYITGYFDGTAEFGSTTLTSSGGYDVFIAKVDSSGNYLWTVKAGGTGFYDRGNGIAVDSNGNSYITGYFDGTAEFGSTTLSSAGEYDVFIAKVDSSGNYLWAVKAGGSDLDEGWGITVDSNGNSYITGYFYLTADFGSTTLTSAGETDVFIAKYIP